MDYDQFIEDMLVKAEEAKLQGDFEKAVDLLQKIIIDEPNCVEAYEEVGDCYLSMQKKDKAEKALKQAIKLNPKSANAHYLLGFLLSVDQRWTASVKELELADELSPNHPEILRCLGWSVYNQNRRSQQGVALLERSRALAPEDPNVLCDLGVCYLNADQYAKAQQLFQQVIKIAPNSEQAHECRNFMKIIEAKVKAEKKPSDSTGKAE